MAYTGNNVILVQLRTPYKGRTLWLFGSKKAIYDHLPAEVVGIGLTTLQNRYLHGAEPYENTKCIMHRLELCRAASNRGRKGKENK